MRYRIALVKLYDDQPPQEVRAYFAATEREALAKQHVLELEVAMHLKYRPEDRHVVDVRPVALA
jgi:hypothetical protein